jgi:SAM-dependent methyltransferase
MAETMHLQPPTRRGAGIRDKMARNMTAQHWDQIFRTKDTHQVSWYQQKPGTSLALIADTHGAVIDVGAGSSTLVDELLTVGRTDLTVLDISETALELTRRRLAHRAEHVTFEVADITTWQPQRTYEVWHDRAVFHFLTNPADQAFYVDLVARAINPGGALVLGTFADNGPTQCSGLPTARYNATDLADRFSASFDLEMHTHETHQTPAGTEQSFTWVKLRRRQP